MLFVFIKISHPFSFLICIKDIYNLFSVKILILHFFISLLFLMIMLFYSDNDIEFYYMNKGKFNFGNEFGKILVTSLICIIINMIIKLLMYNQKYIQKIKDKNILDEKTLKNEIEKFFWRYDLKLKIFSGISSAIIFIIFFIYSIFL